MKVDLGEPVAFSARNGIMGKWHGLHIIFHISHLAPFRAFRIRDFEQTLGEVLGEM